MKSFLIRIDEIKYEQLKLKAQSSNKSVSALAREAMAKYLEGEMLQKDDPLLTLCGKVSSDRKDGAKAHDKYIYRK